MKTTRVPCFLAFRLGIAGLGFLAAFVGTAARTSAATKPLAIYFNDRHSGVSPSRLQRGRVLGAVARNGTVLVPARALFEALGARVDFDRTTGVFHATKPGTDVELRTGRAQLRLNGESRPLDVPPEVRDGVLFVPMRVVSEALGGYVEWLPERRSVAIRFDAQPAAPRAPATPSPPPTPAPVAPTAPLPTPMPTPSPKASRPYIRFVAVDLALAPVVANEFAAKLTGRTTQTIRAAVEYKLHLLGDSRSFVEGIYRRYNYPHDTSGLAVPSGTPCSPTDGAPPLTGDPGCVTTIGRTGSLYQSATRLDEEDLEFRSSLAGIGHAYLATASLSHRNKYGYPNIKSAFGIGAELLPNVTHRLALYGSAYYFPEANGVYTTALGDQFRLRYRIFEYEGGGTISIPSSPVFLEAGVQGDHYSSKQNAPSDTTHRAYRLGVGLQL